VTEVLLGGSRTGEMIRLRTGAAWLCGRRALPRSISSSDQHGVDLQAEREWIRHRQDHRVGFRNGDLPIARVSSDRRRSGRSPSPQIRAHAVPDHWSSARPRRICKSSLLRVTSPAPHPTIGRSARTSPRSPNQPPGLKCLGDQARSSIVSLDEPKCASRPRPGLGGRRHVEIGSGTRRDARVES